MTPWKKGLVFALFVLIEVALVPVISEAGSGLTSAHETACVRVPEAAESIVWFLRELVD